MEKNKATFLTDFIIENDAEASFKVGGYNNWIKLVITDDKPNGNKQRIPKEEFANLMKTGLYMPVKMAYGSIEDDHKEAFPLGVLTNFKESVGDSYSKLEGLAVLWSRERPEDIEYIGSKVSSEQPPQVSWELSYSESAVDDSGIQELRGVSLDAVCIVGMPAYAGRTPITAFASQKTNTEEDSVEELDQLRTQLETASTELAGKNSELESAKSELEAVKVELETLRTYKASIEEKEAKDASFASIKTKFSEAGIEKDEEYFSTNRENLLSMNEATLDFMIQELVSLKSTASASQNLGSKIPQIPNTSVNLSEDPKELGRLLRKSK